MTTTNLLLLAILFALLAILFVLAPGLAEFIGAAAIGLVVLAALAVGALYLMVHPDILWQIGSIVAGLLGIVAGLIGIVAVGAVLGAGAQKLQARFGGGLGWIMIGLTFFVPCWLMALGTAILNRDFSGVWFMLIVSVVIASVVRLRRRGS